MNSLPTALPSTLSHGARAVERCDLLGRAPYSDMENALYRAWLTPAHKAALGTLEGWMTEAGMAVRMDAMGNLIGRYEGTRPDLAPLMIASHIDSVRDAGFYDGPLGVMLGVECVAALHEAGRRLPFAIEVVAFGDEEGSRFPAAMLTSRAMAGTLDEAALDMADARGVTLAEAMADFGLDIARWREAKLARAPLAYLEAHIEQGPVLEAQGLALGTVTGIAAQLRYQITVLGKAGHAGTCAMGLRQDALTAASEMVLAVEEIARADASDLVATVGRMAVLPGAANVIPGEAVFTLDVRSGDEARRDRAADTILARIRELAKARGLGVGIEKIHNLPASPCAPDLMDLMDGGIAATGQQPFRLVSGAGHDAMVMEAICPTAMLFIRCRGGVSHNPAEHVEVADVEAAFTAMMRFIEDLGARYV
ncbi:allantoate amidohydrolase [Novosphingobium terrae]|uniref:allantoate amidohydrolase n=1 Tax=Novosphingobium terrae TaxID=2726189 RepID=UPI0019817C43|nr:allantoate amidohydrolase [Novosphingobium terrae]